VQQDFFVRGDSSGFIPLRQGCDGWVRVLQRTGEKAREQLRASVTEPTAVPASRARPCAALYEELLKTLSTKASGNPTPRWQAGYAS
jgi:hypothetical protein